MRKIGPNNWVRQKQTYPFGEDKRDRYEPFTDVRNHRGSFKQPGYNPDSQSTSISDTNINRENLILNPYTANSRNFMNTVNRLSTVELQIDESYNDLIVVNDLIFDIDIERIQTVKDIDKLNNIIADGSLPADQLIAYKKKVIERTYKLQLLTIDIEKERYNRSAIYFYINTMFSNMCDILGYIDKFDINEQDRIKFTNIYNRYNTLVGTSILENIYISTLNLDIEKDRVTISTLYSKAMSIYNEYTTLNNTSKIIKRDIDNVVYTVSEYAITGIDTTELNIKLGLLNNDYEKYNLLKTKTHNIYLDVINLYNNLIVKVILFDTYTVSYIEDYNISKDIIINELTDYCKKTVEYLIKRRK